MTWNMNNMIKAMDPPPISTKRPHTNGDNCPHLYTMDLFLL